MPTVRQAPVCELLDHISAKLKYPALVMVGEISDLAPPWRDAFPEDEPPVRGVSCGMPQRVHIRLLNQSSHDIIRQMTTSNLSQAAVVTDPKRLMEQSRNAPAVRLWTPYMLNRPLAGPGRVSQPDDAAAQDHSSCLFFRKQLWSGHAVNNPNALGTTHRTGWHDDLQMRERSYASPYAKYPS
jgi:hypothetical protein